MSGDDEWWQQYTGPEQDRIIDQTAEWSARCIQIANGILTDPVQVAAAIDRVAGVIFNAAWEEISMGWDEFYLDDDDDQVDIEPACRIVATRLVTAAADHENHDLDTWDCLNANLPFAGDDPGHIHELLGLELGADALVTELRDLLGLDRPG